MIKPDWPQESCGIAIVGEAPGAEEEKQGRPFVGKSGQLLDRILDACSIPRPNCLVTNVFLTRPPDNDVSHFFTINGNEGCENLPRYRGVVVKNEFAIGSVPRLWEELVEFDPMMVIALGATAHWALNVPISYPEARGKLVKSTIAGVMDLQVFCHFHPSYLLRKGGNIEPVVADLIPALEQIARNSPKLSEE